jgi:hypothetical protein
MATIVQCLEMKLYRKMQLITSIQTHDDAIKSHEEIKEF